MFEELGIDQTAIMLLLPLLLIQLILVVIAVIDWVKTENTNGPKWMWLLIILFISLFGPIIYFIMGRRNRG